MKKTNLAISQTQQAQNQVMKNQKKKSTVILSLILVLITTIATATVLGFKYFETQKQLIIANQELDNYKLAALPQIEKNATIQTVDDYYAFIAREEFVSKYKLKLDSKVQLHFRDFETPTLPQAGDFGEKFSIAYIKTDGEKHYIYFSVPYTEAGTTVVSTRYVYVTLSEISAKLPNAATGSFVV